MSEKLKIFKKQNVSEYEIFHIPAEPSSYYSFVSNKVSEKYNQYTFTVKKFTILINDLTKKEYVVSDIALLESDQTFSDDINQLILQEDVPALTEKISFLNHYEEVDIKSVTFKKNFQKNNCCHFIVKSNGIIIFQNIESGLDNKLTLSSIEKDIKESVAENV